MTLDRNRIHASDGPIIRAKQLLEGVVVNRVVCHDWTIVLQHSWIVDHDRGGYYSKEGEHSIPHLVELMLGLEL